MTRRHFRLPFRFRWVSGRVGRFAAFALAIVIVAPAPARADEVQVDVELILAVDISGSVDYQEAQLQRDGYVHALASPEFVAAVQSGYRRRIAVTYIEWAGAGFQTDVIDWAIIDSAQSARAFADRLAAAPIESGPWTSISGVIDFAAPKFDGNGYQGARRVIDISGDGPNNSGILVTDARDRAVARGIVINGLPIVNDRIQPSGRPQIPNLDKYYANCVIGGVGAFLVVAADFQDFARAVRRKLILEIAGVRPLESRPAGRISGLHKVSNDYPPGCDIGERLLEQRRRILNPQDF